MQVSNLIRKVFVGAVLALVPAASYAGVFISVAFAPPVLPVYTQPALPRRWIFVDSGLLGLWAGGYYWVPGVWVHPPRSACCGLRLTGAGAVERTCSMPATGGRMSVFMAASTMGLVMAVLGLLAGAGRADGLPTTPRC